jgi:hypothetical protein
MNMKRGLVLSLSALALAMGSSVAQAQNVQLSLNLRYTDPADPSEGGQWFLVAKTDDADGIAGISAYINNINTAGMSYGANGTNGYPTVTAAQLGAILNGGQPYNTTIGGAVNVVYGQDTANGPIIVDVGQGAGTPGNVAVDPLRNTAWNNAAVIANGTFGATRPAIAAVGGGVNATDANTLASSNTTPPNNSAQDAATTATVRGDSLASLGLNTPANAGLLAGDANRDGSVSGADFNTLAFNFGDTPPAGGFGWDQGDFNDDGMVSGADFNSLAFNFGDPAPPAPTVGAVPEPATLGLIGIGAMGIMTLRRRRS